MEREFRHLEKEVAAFQQATGLSCLARCGRCCHYPDISATPLEFLPLAYHLYKTGQAETWLERITLESTGLCPLFKPVLRETDPGFCGSYPHRGLVCRLFGFSAIRDKQGVARLATCKPLKEERGYDVQRADQHVAEGREVPVMHDYYFRLMAIDPALSRQLVPIREAIRQALLAVLAYYSFRRPRKSG
ncbi:YkgJ family cysteine cluster protein [Robiginitalea sediminis]|uniref:YkgJ family cysteine cluster protein n=1 Tax=Robiginitalea sediminis TaxID=1982593 RepID=UPI001303B110|nr:YkgJ family cysteine cluster protein [Robiginitalea sediminis]